MKKLCINNLHSLRACDIMKILTETHETVGDYFGKGEKDL